MRTSSRFVSAGISLAAATLLAACSYTRNVTLAPPATTVAAAPTVVVPAAPAAIEFGRVTNIEYFPGGTAATRVNIPGAIIGGVAGAVIGNQVGRATGGRDATTVLGGAAGAAVGSQVGTAAVVTDPSYRVTVQTDSGILRTYDVPATGDLRIGDRVRVENSLIYRY